MRPRYRRLEPCAIRRPTRLAATLLAAMVLASACGGGDDGDSNEPGDSATDTATDGATASDATATEDGSAPLTASWTGVTADTVRLGVALVDFEALLEFDVDLEAGPIADEWRAWAAARNAAGGVNGREIEVAVESFLPVGNEEALAACVSLTEDHEVFAVTGQFLADNPLCVTEGHETPYVGLFGLNPQRAERSRAPFLATEMAEDLQRRHATEILVEDGLLAGKRVGVHYGAEDAWMADDIVLPMLEEAGIDVVATSQLDSFGGDVQAGEEAMAVNIERMRNAEVEVIVNLSSPLPLVVPLQDNDFAPQLVFFNGQATDGGQFEGGAVDPKYLEGAVAITVNKPPREELLDDEMVVRCVDEYNDTNPAEPLVIDEMSLGELRSTATNCAGFHLFVQLAEAAGPELTPDGLLAAAEAFGPIDLPSMPGASLGPGKHSAGNAMRIYEYDATENEMLPISDPIVVTD